MGYIVYWDGTYITGSNNLADNGQPFLVTVGEETYARRTSQDYHFDENGTYEVWYSIEKL